MNIKKNSTYIIAEIGINHDGKLDRAKKLIRLAKKSGVDAVKFQAFNPETMAQKISQKTDLQKKSTSQKETLYQMWNRVKFSKREFNDLRKLCKNLSLDFICSVFDEENLKIIKNLKPAAIKIASSDINDLNLIKEAKKTKLPLIISTGMASYNEINRVLKVAGKKNNYVLHCVSMYPAPDKKINIKRMITLKKKFNINTGYSDHSNDKYASMLAISLGAKVLEKHFTDNKKKIGADHNLSADLNEMREIVNFSKKISFMKGDGVINPTNQELKYKKFFRKGIYALRKINKGDKFSTYNIIKRRPFNTSDLAKFSYLLKKKSAINYQPLQTIKTNKKNYF